jgi:hypothetical protein
MVDDDGRLAAPAAMRLFDENRRLRDEVAQDNQRWAAIAAMMYDQIVVRKIDERYAIETVEKVVRAASKVRV